MKAAKKRKAGRPPLPAAQRKEAFICVSITKEHLKHFKAQAAAHNMKPQDYLRSLISEAISDRQHLSEQVA